MRFCLSPDEDPFQSGTTAGGLIERDENVKVATFLQAALQRCGQDVWFDDTITYVERVPKANSDGTNVLVACAHNAADSPAAEGTVFIFCPPNGRNFGRQWAAAENVGTELVNAGISGRWAPLDEQVYECCQFSGDTVYCELLFQTNARDVDRMKQPGYHHDAAEAMCRGLATTYGFAYVLEAAQDNITWVQFSGAAMGDTVGVYDGPSSRLHHIADVHKGDRLSFDGWMRGETQTDLSRGTPDNRWFHRAPDIGWTASAWIDGNPPNSTPQ
jgi:hypothetical protein